MLIERDTQTTLAPPSAETAEEAARRLVTRLPADQALGLRLMALARAAAAVHMAAAAGADPRLGQAAALLREARR